MSAIYEVLRQLDEWRHLPGYQLERRVDILFGMFLPKVIESVFDVHVDEVIPEFPLHKGLLKCPPNVECGPHHSVKVDFAVFGTKGDKKKVFLVELKTDDNSLNQEQLKNMQVAQRVRSKAVLEAVRELAQHSPQKRKYAHLVWKLYELNCLELCNRAEFVNMRLEEDRPRLKSAFEKLSVAQEWCEANVELVVILPTEKKKEEIPSGFEVLTFAQFAEHLEDGNQPFESSDVSVFADYLRHWAGIEAGRVSPWPQQH